MASVLLLDSDDQFPHRYTGSHRIEAPWPVKFYQRTIDNSHNQFCESALNIGSSGLTLKNKVDNVDDKLFFRFTSSDEEHFPYQRVIKHDRALQAVNCL